VKTPIVKTPSGFNPTDKNVSTQGLSFGLPAPNAGLWQPQMEGDACGIGFVADTSGVASHRILKKSLEAVCCLTHRGAVAADAKTGDGAGVLTQIPYAILRASLGRGQSKLLRRDEDLAVAMMFFPQDTDARHRAYRICEAVVEEHDLIFLGWRLVPTDKDSLGDKARQGCPEIRQLLLARLDNMDDNEFERTCYRLRKSMEERIAAEGIEGFYIPSFSSRTVVYKGMMVAPQLSRFYGDLADERYETALGLYHQRYSTNTFPTWFLAQPFRMLAHNGEINTLQGNYNWMRARGLSRDAAIWGSSKSLAELQPIVQPGGSDSSALDNALESVVLGGRDLLHAAMMMAPEAYRAVPDMDEDVRAFYEYHACLQEPWDGPAALSFTDGRVIGATLDRNGLRPARYQVSDDGLFVMGSEVGLVELEGAKVLEKGRLGPGQIIALDTQTGELLKNDDIKKRYALRASYRHWVNTFLVEGASLIGPEVIGHGSEVNGADNNGAAAETDNPSPITDNLLVQQKAFGYTVEDVDDIVKPMVGGASEPIGSMGDDTPLAVLSEKPRSLFTYFRQRFAQVTNPPIDPLREKLVMSLDTHLGPASNLWEEKPEAARRIRFTSPVLLDEQLAAIREKYSSDDATFKVATIDTTFAVAGGEDELYSAIKRVREEAAREVENGASLGVLSDRNVEAKRAPIPSLLAVGATHHHLIRNGLRMRASIIVESGEPRDSHHFACLLGYGAQAVNPWLALATTSDLHRRGETSGYEGDIHTAQKRFVKAIEGGLLKIMSKIGISTLASYMAAQTFEALGLAPELVDECFEHTPSRIKGVSYAEIACDVLKLHSSAYPSPVKAEAPETESTPAANSNGASKSTPIKLENFAFLRYRKDGEQHAFTPSWFKPFHKAVREGDYTEQYKIYSDAVNERPKPIALRDLLEWSPLGEPIPLEEVEPVEAIFPRLATGAMSHGALSSEAHECLAIAMNRLGGRSNSGEGGEDPRRFQRDPNGDWRNSQIKQIASARFGVTPEYLASAKELQIKMAQGAKPGEGGQLPGFKVSAEIAFIRHSVPGVTLISPPPHHDIYSIEDLAQLIYDLKQVNPRARVSVKLVAQAGVGTVAAGVAKAYADTIVISGHDGGTGASPVGSIKNTGVSWELGLAEAQQVLIQNGLRGRVRLHADGGFKTGRDVIIAALLGAEEYGFGTAALMAAGCVMARQCHLNTCPVGVATQREDLRAKFPGTPDHVVNFMTFVANEVREYLASIGARHLDQIIGRTDLLKIKDDAVYPKTSNVDLAPLFYQFDRDNNPHRCGVGKNTRPQDWPVDEVILQDARDAIADGRELTLHYPIKNTDRTVGARLAGDIAYRYGDRGLPSNTLTVKFKGSAGQSFGAFCINGLRLELMGEACDYVGKTMHGGTIVVRPHDGEIYTWHENAIIGNTVMYGATGGHLFAAGRAGERFCVRNSGGTAVIEGIGDHGCEYMTGGVVVVLGETGLNFGAGMSGGIAYVYDEFEKFPIRFNPDMVGIEPVHKDEDIAQLRSLIERHAAETGSPRAAEILADWETHLDKFHKVVPHPEKSPAPTPEKKRERVARVLPAKAETASHEAATELPESADFKEMETIDIEPGGGMIVEKA
jgi:glutamate synthase domain-containing protein 2/glutamate synthase domain-containing protein 1/glutamate synthase domain-containing protein 3